MYEISQEFAERVENRCRVRLRWFLVPALLICPRLAIPAFLRSNIKEEIHQRNRIDVLDYVKHVSSRATLGELETLVLAWGQIARSVSFDSQQLLLTRNRACGEDELNIVLLQLVDLLGHTHPLICGVAYNEVSRENSYETAKS